MVNADNYKRVFKEKKKLKEFINPYMDGGTLGWRNQPRRQTTWDMRYGQQPELNFNPQPNWDMQYTQQPIEMNPTIDNLLAGSEEPLEVEAVKPDFVKSFLKILVQIRLFHWQTRSNAEHIALGDYYDSMSDLIDLFVESYQGRSGERVCLSDSTFASSIDLVDYTEENMLSYNKEVYDFIQGLQAEIEDSQLDNILDEMKSTTDKLSYRLTLM